MTRLRSPRETFVSALVASAAMLPLAATHAATAASFLDGIHRQTQGNRI